VDYSIFIQLALRRHGGDLDVVRRSIGRALLLCGGTAMAGFGSLAWSSNPGMASLGRVCAVGIGANMLISVFLLPAWWVRVNAGSRSLPGKSSSPRSSRGLPGRSIDAKTGDEAPLSSPCAPPREGDRSLLTSAATVQSGCKTRPAPSSFYRGGLWRFGLAIVRIVPEGFVEGSFAESWLRSIRICGRSAAGWWWIISCRFLPETGGC